MAQDFFDLFNGTDNAKNRFGMLRMFSTPCSLKAGASYSLPDVLDKDGQPMMFKGKQPNPSSGARHIVFALSQKNQEGQPYTAVRQWMSFDAEYKERVKPALFQAVAAANLNPQPDQAIPIALEEVGGGGTYQASDGSIKERTIWVVTKVFGSQAEMEAAEAAFWSSMRVGAYGTEAHAPALNGWQPEPESAAAGWNAETLQSQSEFFKAQIAEGKSIMQVAAENGLALADMLIAVGEHRTKLAPIMTAHKYGYDAKDNKESCDAFVTALVKVRDQASVIPF